ncbi:MAG: protein arginine kinase [Clostridiales bacterium]|nr:protein arginine kinase [Clostridiales bacterium]
MTDWINGDGPDNDIVLSSRIRLARNIKGMPFTDQLDGQGAARVIDMIKEAIQHNPVLARDFNLTVLKDISPLDARVLVEDHLISPALVERRKSSAVFIRKDCRVSIMVNEEDHIRMQVLLPGLQLEEGWDLASKIDDVLEESINYAFNENMGYLTACPTNTGTGMRASVMVHLPALVLTNQFNRVSQALNQLGLAVRGIYGEGTEVVGNMVQISNQLTLGKSEEHIIESLKGMTKEIINKEKQTRDALVSGNRTVLEDKVCRSYGLLTKARIISSRELMELLSDVRLGMDLGLLTGINRRDINEIMLESQPASLQKKAGKQLSDTERDVFRSELIRKKLG